MAKKIIEIAENHNISAKNASSYIQTFSRRWYDADEELSLAMSYFKKAEPEIQKSIAINVINFLCEMEN